ncbi:Stf0 family sulfotransferase [Georgenia alba]|uniref:Stf0 family sulfotransferase n=1 Tax=Georgenia alba TaxID=2233858 RepID=A0ABW2Q579_9MICO
MLSTQRSGSTFLCDQLRLRGGFVTHEYFNARYYLPILAERWACLSPAGVLDVPRYVAQLRSRRAGDNGVLGVNVHGSQLPVFLQFLDHLTDLEVQVVRVEREDKLAQAVSMAIAEQTRQWSRHFSPVATPRYDPDHITRKLEDIARQTAMIEAFCAVTGFDARTTTYERMTADGQDPLSVVDGIEFGAPQGEGLVSKQRGETNREWKSRYVQDCLALAAGSDPHSAGLVRRAGRRLARSLRLVPGGRGK